MEFTNYSINAQYSMAVDFVGFELLFFQFCVNDFWRVTHLGHFTRGNIYLEFRICSNYIFESKIYVIAIFGDIS